ncbi:hypothetical protein RGQ29_017248 [Quercus rubra]|uniref:Uncharacterized protein n=1 Tax=Quercus rubra TaxID=3512 RepID=A0AAN7FGL0_QUERU|nr:hypothetical protein RGQ29_017248 [Quercus rubra]
MVHHYHFYKIKNAHQSFFTELQGQKHTEIADISYKPAQFLAKNQRQSSRMDGNHSGNERTRSEQEIRSITALLALFSFILGFLLTLVGFKYPSSGAALFHKHHAIMLGLMIDLVTFTTVLVAAMLPITNRNCFHFFQKVCLFFGALACNLLIFILVPILGWVFFTFGVSILVYLLYGSYRMIFKFCQQNLKSISNWFRQKFQDQSSSQLSSQTSNGSPMLTPTVTEKQMTGIGECLSEDLP